ncbi:MAG: hypothetical protein AAF483_03290 [Planctomycetota bacterium]
MHRANGDVYWYELELQWSKEDQQQQAEVAGSKDLKLSRTLRRIGD